MDGLALSGRIRLYRGDIAGAVERFKAAGPFAGDRAEATERTALLALLQPIEADSLPALGAGALELEQRRHRRGSGRPRAGGGRPAAGAGRRRAPAARRTAWPPRPGSRRTRSDCSARRRAGDAPGTAPAAELALAELLLASTGRAEAIAQLEHLILTYPESALVPQARRLLDQARGAVPQT